VSGAIVTAMPRPITTIAGKNVVQYDPSTPAAREKPNPPATTNGPTVSGRRGPTRPTSPPDHRESTNRITANGTSAAPASVGGVAVDLNQIQRQQEHHHAERAVEQQRQDVGERERARREEPER